MHIYTQMLVTKIAANQKSCNAQKNWHNFVHANLHVVLHFLEPSIAQSSAPSCDWSDSLTRTLMLLARTKGKYFTEQNQKMYY